LIGLIEDKKGENIVVIDVSQITTIANYIVIITATSMVHANSLSRYIIDFFSEHNKNGLYTKKEEKDNPWILIDTSDIIVHIFQKETREYYNLEKIYFKGRMII